MCSYIKLENLPFLGSVVGSGNNVSRIHAYITPLSGQKQPGLVCMGTLGHPNKPPMAKKRAGRCGPFSRPPHFHDRTSNGDAFVRSVEFYVQLC